MFADSFARLEHLVRPALKFVSPHAQTALFSAGRRVFLELLAHESVPVYEPPKSLERVLWGVPHQGPLMWAAGIDKAGKLYHVSANQGAAAHMVGTTTHGARRGNIKQGIRNPCVPFVESGHAINFLGLPNEGHRVVAGRVFQYERKQGCPVWASVMENSEQKTDDERKEGVIEGFHQYELARVDVLERNTSCPNTKHAQTGFRESLKYDGERYVRRTRKPVGLKVSNDARLEDVPMILDTAFEEGFAFVNFGNTSTDYESASQCLSDREKRLLKYFSVKFGGGFSGPKLKEKSLALCARAVEYVKSGGPGREFHIVRTGGIGSAKDLIESDQAGVSMNQWVTGYWNRFGEDGHDVYKRILEGYAGLKK